MAEDHTFCRLLSATIMQDVRIVVPVEKRKKAWTYKHDCGYINTTYEFHGPRDFYWYGQAHCKWDARAQGWTAYLAKYHPEFENEQTTYEDVALAKMVG